MASKSRSPNYPALTLPQAVEAARKLWAAEKRTAVSHETAAQSMGYKSLSGPARVTIGALRQYGLIDKAEKGHIRLSDLAVNILHGGEIERLDAMAEAATNPPLFHELGASHADASENAIRSYLITKKGFVEDGARKAAKAFRETIGVVTKSDSGYTPPIEQEKPEAMPELNQGQNDPDGAGKATGGTFSLSVPFAKGTISVLVRVTGDAMRPSYLARVRKYLELAESDWGTADDEMGVPRPSGVS